MEYNNLQHNTTWGEAASDVNENFLRTGTEIEKLKSATTRHKGYFGTLSDLQSAYPSPQIGDNAWVGATYPGIVYDCVKNGEWRNTSKSPNTDSVDLTNYTLKEDFNNLAGEFQKRAGELEGDINSLAGEVQKKASELDQVRTTANNAIPTSQKNKANGVAGLDANGYIASSQLDGELIRWVSKTQKIGDLSMIDEFTQAGVYLYTYLIDDYEEETGIVRVTRSSDRGKHFPLYQERIERFDRYTRTGQMDDEMNVYWDEWIKDTPFDPGVIGKAGGAASLNSEGKVPANQLSGSLFESVQVESLSGLDNYGRTGSYAYMIAPSDQGLSPVATRGHLFVDMKGMINTPGMVIDIYQVRIENGKVYSRNGKHDEVENTYSWEAWKEASGSVSGDYIPTSQKGVSGGVVPLETSGKIAVKYIPVGDANGVAPLNSAGKVPLSALPYASDTSGGIIDTKQKSIIDMALPYGVKVNFEKLNSLTNLSPEEDFLAAFCIDNYADVTDLLIGLLDAVTKVRDFCFFEQNGEKGFIRAIPFGAEWEMMENGSLVTLQYSHRDCGFKIIQFLLSGRMEILEVGVRNMDSINSVINGENEEVTISSQTDMEIKSIGDINIIGATKVNIRTEEENTAFVNGSPILTSNTGVSRGMNNGSLELATEGDMVFNPTGSFHVNTAEDLTMDVQGNLNINTTQTVNFESLPEVETDAMHIYVSTDGHNLTRMSMEDLKIELGLTKLELPEGVVGMWSAKEKSNEERLVENFTTNHLYYNKNAVIDSYTAKSYRVTNWVSRNNPPVYRYVDPGETYKIKLRITGVPSYGLLYFSIGYNTGISQVIDQDGEYDIELTNTLESRTTAGLRWNQEGECNIHVEQPGTDRSVLDDLSGNGNHIQLYNFLWTEDSGYAPDGYLKFDGIDDYGACDPFPVIKDYTVIIERESGLGIVASKSKDIGYGGFIFETRTNQYSRTYSFGSYKNVAIEPSTITWQTRDSYNGQELEPYSGRYDQDGIFIGDAREGGGYYFNGKIRRMIIFNRTLSQEEIQQSIKYLKRI